MKREKTKQEVIKRTFYTDEELKSLDAKLSPYLENGVLLLKGQFRFYSDLKLCKAQLRKNEDGSFKKGTVMSDWTFVLNQDKVDSFFEMEEKIDFWRNWKSRQKKEELF